jgi:hypothetical protein
MLTLTLSFNHGVVALMASHYARISSILVEEHVITRNMGLPMTATTQKGESLG